MNSSSKIQHHTNLFAAQRKQTSIYVPTRPNKTERGKKKLAKNNSLRINHTKVVVCECVCQLTLHPCTMCKIASNSSHTTRARIGKMEQATAVKDNTPRSKHVNNTFIQSHIITISVLCVRYALFAGWCLCCVCMYAKMYNI